MHEALLRRRKRNDESFFAYLQQMRYLGKQDNIIPQEMRQYVIHGLANNMHMCVALAGATSEENCVEMLKAFDRESQDNNSSAAAGRNQQGSNKNWNHSNEYGRRERTCCTCENRVTLPEIVMMIQLAAHKLVTNTIEQGMQRVPAHKNFQSQRSNHKVNRRRIMALQEEIIAGFELLFDTKMWDWR